MEDPSDCSELSDICSFHLLKSTNCSMFLIIVICTVICLFVRDELVLCVVDCPRLVVGIGIFTSTSRVRMYCYSYVIILISILFITSK